MAKKKKLTKEMLKSAERSVRKFVEEEEMQLFNNKPVQIKPLMSDLMDRYEIYYKGIDFDTMERVEMLTVIDKKTGRRYGFTKEFLLDQLILPWMERFIKPKKEKV